MPAEKLGAGRDAQGQVEQYPGLSGFAAAG